MRNVVLVVLHPRGEATARRGRRLGREAAAKRAEHRRRARVSARCVRVLSESPSIETVELLKKRVSFSSGRVVVVTSLFQIQTLHSPRVAAGR